MDGLKQEGRAFQAGLSGEKHHQKKNGKKKEGYYYQYQYRDQYGRYGGQTHRQQSSACKNKTNLGNGIRGYESTNASDLNGSTVTAPTSNQHAKHKKDYKRVSMPRLPKPSSLITTQSGKMKLKTTDKPPQPAPLLIPIGRTGERSSNLKDRKRHPRLNGADLYVARLGSCSNPPSDKPTKQPTARPSSSTTDPSDLTSSTTSLPPSPQQAQQARVPYTTSSPTPHPHHPPHPPRQGPATPSN